MKSRILMSFALLVLLAVSGCRPTPAESAIVNNDIRSISDAVLVAADPDTKYLYPSNWSEVFDVRGRLIRIDAAVEAAKGPFSVILVENRSFERDEITSILGQFAGMPLQIRDNKYSRDELLTDIKNTEKGCFIEIDPNTGEQIWEPYDGQQEELQQLHHLLEATPDEDRYVLLTVGELPDDLAYFVVKTADGELLYVRCFNKQNRINISRNRSMIIQTEAMVLSGEATPGEEAHYLTDIVVTEEEAVAVCEKMLDAVNAPKYLKQADIEKARGVEQYTYHCLGEGYLVRYTSADSGTVPFYYEKYTDSDAFYFPQEEAYGPRWEEESITMFVTESGVQELCWTGPKKELDTVNDHAALLPFEEVQARAKDLIGYGILGNKTDTSLQGDVLVTDIVLGSALLKLPDQQKQAYQAPVWMFVVTTERRNDMGEEPSILMINALTGAYVNRWGW